LKPYRTPEVGKKHAGKSGSDTSTEDHHCGGYLGSIFDLRIKADEAAKK
jgi:hypothetical protein